MKYAIYDPESESLLAELDPEATGVSFELNNGVLVSTLSAAGGGERVTYPVHHNPATGVVSIATPLGNIRLRPARGAARDRGASGKAGSRALKSSMPGKVLRVLCKPGDQVQSGQALLVIEAMKMENEIRSTQAGRIEAVGVQAGQTVSQGDMLVKIGPGDGA
jgi:biotin carboxyl carrier protein